MKLKSKEKIYTKTFQILSSFFNQYLGDEWYKKRLNIRTVDKLLNNIDRMSKLDIARLLKRAEVEIKNKFKKAYYTFIKSDRIFKVPMKTVKVKHELFPNKKVSKKVIDIKGYRLTDLKKKLQKELNDRINISLQYINTQTDNDIRLIKKKILDWATLRQPTILTQSEKNKLNRQFWHEVVDDNVQYKTKKHINFILRDQRNKMISNFNNITAIDSGAIGFIWRNMRDKRVVGNPSGLYPNGNDTHGDHWKREGKLYLIRGSWAEKQGYIKKNKDVEYSDEIVDGIPRQSINCRCSAEYIYVLSSIPRKYSNIITEKGKGIL